MKVNLTRIEARIPNGVIADVKKDDMSNGVGVRVTVFCTGCPLNCYNCFNKKIQSYNYGYKEAKIKHKGYPKFYSKEVEDEIISYLTPSYISGLTLLGGEPFLNVKSFLPLCKRVRKEFGNAKNIWSWTGFEWEELMQMTKLKFSLSKMQKKYLNTLDVLVDGRYVDSIRKLDKSRNNKDIHFRGSSNQRIIDVKKSLDANNIVERTDLYKDEICVNRCVDFKKLTGKESIPKLLELGL